MDDLVKMARGESTAHFEGNVRDRRTIGALLSSLSDAIEALQARVAELEAKAKSDAMDYLADTGQLLDHLETARRDAFKEAARVADLYYRKAVERSEREEDEAEQNRHDECAATAGSIAVVIRALAKKG